MHGICELELMLFLLQSVVAFDRYLDTSVCMASVCVEKSCRMSREGAARTYHMYTYWGYFNRRMSARRQLEQKTMPGSKESTGIAFGDNSKQQKSYYGEMTNVWRYFENVPDAISDLRTKEAAQVADRHLRSVFSLNHMQVMLIYLWTYFCISCCCGA